MKILVIGSGGREHALVKALKGSPQVTTVLAAPGNPGMTEATCYPIPVSDQRALIQLAKEQKVDLTIVGPEKPLVEGIVDCFQDQDLKIFGPSQAAAQLEGSKAFTKDFLKKYQIPTAKYEVFDQFEEAKNFVEANRDTEWVVKVDGLAAGKGVFVSRSPEATIQALQEIFIKQNFGKQKVVLEEFLNGEELSFMALCDGKHALPLASSQDHKRLLDGDQGPNTGGMGAYSPALLMDSVLEEKIIRRILNPTLEGMKTEGHPFSGILYAGLMIIGGEPYVLEYNVRFGDPEAQVILPRLKSDWVELFKAGIETRLDQVNAQWKPDTAVCVVLAAEGYPTCPKKGDEILGLESASQGAIVYHAGSNQTEEKFFTAGGRVLGVTALGSDLKTAIQKSYEALNKICFRGMQFRKDIGQKGIK